MTAVATVIAVTATTILLATSAFLLAVPTAHATLPPGWYEKYQLKLEQAKNEKISTQEQMDIYIKMYDVVCFDGKEPVLKMSANHVVCVNPSTVKKLVERGWGINKSWNSDIHVPEEGWWCSTYAFDISVDPAKSLDVPALIKHIRTTMLPFAESTTIWEEIRVSFREYSTSLYLGGIFTEEHIDTIVSAVQDFEGIDDIDRNYGCMVV